MTPDNSAAGSDLWPITDDGVRQAVEQMLSDGSWGRYHGPHCDRLREALRDYHSVQHTMLCSSGTAAIELALRAVNVAPGDEVILAAYDYKANFANVLTVGARPVLVDTLQGQPLLDPEQLAAAVSSSTKAIICSHLHGCLARMDDVIAFAKAHNLSVIEDACQVPGAALNDRQCGSMGDVGVLSFGGSKLLTAGRGGAVMTQDDRIAQRLRLYTQRGNDAYPLSEMQAAVLLPQLEQLNPRNEQRQRSVIMLREAIAKNQQLRFIENKADEAIPAYYKVPFLSTDETIRTRDDLEHRCEDLPLDSGFLALHLTHAKSRFRAVGELPHATHLHHRLMTLHHPVLLAGDDELSKLARTLAE